MWRAFVGGREIDVSDAYADMVMGGGWAPAGADGCRFFFEGGLLGRAGARRSRPAPARRRRRARCVPETHRSSALTVPRPSIRTRLFGNASLDVALSIAFDADPAEDQIPVAVTGSLTGIALPEVFAGEDLAEGNFQVTYRNGDLEMAGEARLGGDAVELHLTQRPDAPVNVKISTMLDASARARRGIRLGEGLSGELPLVIRTVLDPDTPQDLQIEADLTPARIEGLLPGLSKPRGQAGRLSFILREDDGWLLDAITLEAGATRISGSLAFNRDGQIAARRLRSAANFLRR